MSSESESHDLHILESNLQQLAMQKQSLELEMNEITNALREVTKSKGDVYRVLANVMVKSDKQSMQKELEEKKKLIEMHISSVEKQESLVEAKANELHKRRAEHSLKKEKSTN
mgnify:CR=1 FL=1